MSSAAPRPISAVLKRPRPIAWAAGARMRGILIAPVTGVTECTESCQKRLPRAQPPAEPVAATR